MKSQLCGKLPSGDLTFSQNQVKEAHLQCLQNEAGSDVKDGKANQIVCCNCSAHDGSLLTILGRPRKQK